jgi:glycosyltransferase involved in cell wall biosynthesis
MPPPELMLVMPVFNEQASVAKVVTEWFEELNRITPAFSLLAIDDGSKDDTPEILKGLQQQLGPRMEWISRANRGHGQTCMEGYRIANQREIPFILQIDSDGQSDPAHFEEFWKQRNDFDVIYGKRARKDGFRRVVASYILRCSLRVLAKVDCVDANVPYRLMNTKACANAIHSISENIFLANVALAVALRMSATIRHGSVPIGFPPRHGGEPSVPFLKFASKGIELFGQLKAAGITG